MKDMQGINVAQVRKTVKQDGAYSTVSYCCHCGATVRSQLHCHNCGYKLDWKSWKTFKFGKRPSECDTLMYISTAPCMKSCLVCVNACFDNAKAEILIGTRPFFMFDCLKCPLENAYNFSEERRETILYDPFTSPPSFWVDGGENARNCKNFVFNTAAQ